VPIAALPLIANPLEPEVVVRADRDARLAELLHQAAAGRTSAFEAFYDATIGYARALVRPADLDDLLAEAFFQAWREAARFDRVRGNAVSWLLVIVRSRALDLLRRQRAARDDDTAPDLPDSAPGSDELLRHAQAGTRLHGALAQLSSQERWLLGLAYYRELSHSEIAGLAAEPVPAHVAHASSTACSSASPAVPTAKRAV